MRAVIEHHHVPSGADPEHLQLVQIVHVADGVRAMMGGDGSVDALSYPMDSSLLRALGIGLSEFAEIICDSHNESAALLEAATAEA